jgi:diguanylate cyclase (GGDEF)-like protein/PAS domain S-box-containing protein
MKSRTAHNTIERTILLIDDKPEQLSALTLMLGTEGFHVAIAKSGAQALKTAPALRPDLILLDMTMPRMDGIETCRRLKALNGISDVPVLFMSSMSDGNEHDYGGERIVALAAGGADVIHKPLEIEEVLARIHMHLAVRATQELFTEQGEQLQNELQNEIRLRQQAEAELKAARAQLQKDVDDRKEMERILREKESRMRRLYEANLIGIIFAEPDGSTIDANDAFLKIIGYTREDLRAGRIHWRDLTPPEYQDVSSRGMEEFKRTGSTTYEKEYLRKDGTRVPVLVGMARMDDSADIGAAFVLDLTERKRAEERIRYMADHDSLTELPNRTLFRDRLQQAMTHAHRTHAKVAVLFLDLDDFKNINDSLGHEIGDRLLQMVATRLRECVREDDTVARLGGDEFVLSLPLQNGNGDAALVAHKALHALDLPFECDGHELHLSSSIGISVYPDDGDDVDTLMRTADTAMYHAKAKGRSNYQFFTPALNRAAQRRLSLTNALRRALIRNEFELHYQPQVNVENGNIISAEALLRWNKASKHAVSCNEYIRVAEETGIILQLGEWVLREACKQLKHWHGLGYKDMMMAVNLSPRQFYQPDFQNRIRGILDEEGLEPESLDLEITEGTLMQCSEDNLSTLHSLSDMGIKLSVDDFGTGYSSLAYLQRFPVDALKIDRSFVSGIGEDRNDTTLVEAIISMAHSLRLNVLAEGVETKTQRNFLLSQGCRSAQGFYYSVPVTPDAFTGMLKQQQMHAGRV